jgi:hypothetical protein
MAGLKPVGDPSFSVHIGVGRRTVFRTVHHRSTTSSCLKSSASPSVLPLAATELVGAFIAGGSSAWPASTAETRPQENGFKPRRTQIFPIATATGQPTIFCKKKRQTPADPAKQRGYAGHGGRPKPSAITTVHRRRQRILPERGRSGEQGPLLWAWNGHRDVSREQSLFFAAPSSQLCASLEASHLQP